MNNSKVLFRKVHIFSYFLRKNSVGWIRFFSLSLLLCVIWFRTVTEPRWTETEEEKKKKNHFKYINDIYNNDASNKIIMRWCFPYLPIEHSRMWPRLYVCVCVCSCFALSKKCLCVYCYCKLIWGKNVPKKRNFLNKLLQLLAFFRFHLFLSLALFLFAFSFADILYQCVPTFFPPLFICRCCCFFLKGILIVVYCWILIWMLCAWLTCV